jgi:hypothetical protein
MSTNIAGVLGHVENLQRRVLQDAMTEATAVYWRRRAEQWRLALPWPGDYLGTESTPLTRAARRRRVEAIVAACEAKALVIERYGLGADIEAEIDRILREAA